MKRHWREDLETTTIAGYEQHVRLHLVPLYRGVKLTSLTIPIAENLRDELLERLSRPMTIRVLQSLTAIVQEAKRNGHVSQNVFDDVSIKRSTRTPDVVIPLKGELRMILRLASMSSQPMAMPLIMLL